MRAITLREHPHFPHSGAWLPRHACGIDVRKVAATGLAPLVNTGVASRSPAPDRSAPAHSDSR